MPGQRCHFASVEGAVFVNSRNVIQCTCMADYYLDDIKLLFLPTGGTITVNVTIIRRNYSFNGIFSNKTYINYKFPSYNFIEIFLFYSESLRKIQSPITRSFFKQTRQHQTLFCSCLIKRFLMTLLFWLCFFSSSAGSDYGEHTSISSEG